MVRGGSLRIVGELARCGHYIGAGCGTQGVAVAEWKVGDRRSFVHQFSGEDVSRFVSLTGDDNPVHVSNVYARNTPAGGVIVHGMLAAAYVSTLIGKEIPGDGAVWSSFDVTWRNPIRIGDSVRFEAEIVDIRASTGVMSLSISGVNETRSNVSLEAKAKVILMQPESAERPKSALVGKRILVTGASGVVGSAIAAKLLALGARPVLWGRSGERLALAAGGGEWAEVDLADPKAVDTAVAKVLAGGKLEGLVHVAAPPARAIGVDDPANISELDTHFKLGPMAFGRLCAQVLPTMDAGSGIVVVLTQYVLGMPPPKMSAYVAAKQSLLGMVRSVAVECGPRGIRCNAVSPGMMNTPYSESVPLRLKQIEAATNPLRRLCLPTEVADAVGFLLGPEGSYFNGANLPLTGGAAVV